MVFVKNMHTYLARQPIFDRELNVFAYELLYRSENNPNSYDSSVDGDRATSEVIINSTLMMGLDQVTSGYPALINVSKEFLTAGHLPSSFAGKVIPEILETATVDSKFVRTVQTYIDQGFHIALDDFEFHESWEPLLEIAHIIKLDVLKLGREGTQQHITQLKNYKAYKLAEKIDSYEEFEFYQSLGFDYYQGHFLSKPKLLKEKTIPSSKAIACKLISQLCDPNIKADVITETLTQDARLTYKILKVANSAAMGLPREISSIQEALIFLGFDEVKCWACLLSLISAEKQPDELVFTAMTRAKMCQLIAREMQYSNASAFFTVGLISLFDALMGVSLEDVFMQMPFDEELKRAVCEYAGDMGKVLKAVLLYEQGKWNDLEKNSFPVNLRELYLESLEYLKFISVI